jgi:quinol monooxygenase YgiN
MSAPDPNLPILSIIEWDAPALSPDDARTLAERTARAFRLVPGLIDFRFYGNFETGRHAYLQVWRDQAALDAYAASESMLRIRDFAAPYVTGRPSRALYTDYTPES